MITNENETLITLIGALVIVVITVFQFLAMSRAKSKHHQEMLALGNKPSADENAMDKGQALACKTEKCSLFCNPGHLLQIIFGILVFGTFTWWAIYLVSVGVSEWVPLSGYVALIGLMTPIIAWRGFSHRHQAMIRCAHDLDIAKKASENAERAVVSHAAQPLVTKPALVEPETMAKPVALDEADVLAKPEPAPQVIPDTVVSQEKPGAVQAKPVIIEKQKLPQDSILKRHFLTHLRTQIETAYPLRPTDSILKRHFDNFIAAEMCKYVDGKIEPEFGGSPCAEACLKAVESAVIAGSVLGSAGDAAQSQKQMVPEDSNRKRQYLSPFQLAIESGLLPRPTDSILKRHYDHLVATYQQGD